MRTRTLASVALAGTLLFTGACSDDEDGDGATTDEEIDSVDDSFDNGTDEIDQQIDEGAEEPGEAGDDG